MTELYIEKGGKKLRCGYTTGSCAAAASKAALYMLLSGEKVHNVSIVTPKGPVYTAEILDIEQGDDYVSCAVIKDGGDDPDITTGAYVYAKVALSENDGITIDGGDGVGRVTKPGLDQPVGEAAINSVPRRMIRENLEEVLERFGINHEGVSVIISIPAGRELAQKTFNPKLGIVGGISVLGTTGIVEPMSDEALLQTIKTEIQVRRAEGRAVLLAAPGNYGISFLSEKYKIDENLPVMSSNFVYDTVQMALEEGFEELLFAGHIGKLVKIAGGIKNTHSMYGDHRMEILTELCAECINEDNFKRSDFQELKTKLLDCVMTDEAVRLINEAGIGSRVFTMMADRIKENMEEWSDRKMCIEVIVFVKENGELVSTDGAREMMEKVSDR